MRHYKTTHTAYSPSWGYNRVGFINSYYHIGSITTYVNTVEYCYAEMEGGLIVNRKDLEKAPGYSPKKLKELGNKRYTRKFINGVFIRGKTAAEVRSKIQNALNEVEDNI